MGGDRKILVTGASGLVGRRVVELLQDGGRSVLGTDLVNHNDGAGDFVISDMTNASSIDGLFKSDVAGIIHCGAISGPMLGREDPAGTIAVNVQGTVNLLEQARRHGLGRFVFCSSISAYGATPVGVTPVPTSAPLAADEIYGASKAAADILVRAYAASHGVDAVALRIGWVYGPRRTTRSLLHRLIRDALDGRPTHVEHDGRFRVQLIHVDDVACGLIAAFDQPKLEARAYNLTAGTQTAMSALADAVRRQLPSSNIEFTPGISYPDIEQGLFDIEATRRDLAWSPEIALDVGVSKYIDWLCQHAN